MADSFDLRCPVVTPMNEDGSVDLDGLETLVDYLVSSGIDGLVPCGTTGEFSALTDEERRAVVETTVDAAAERVPVMAGVGGTAVGEVRRHVSEAEAVGADSVLVVPPYFGGQSSADGNEAFFRAVLDDSPLPAYLYNIPQTVGQELQVDAVAELADHDSVVGIKDSGGDLTYFGDLLRRTPDDFEVHQGWDAAYLPSLAMGADGGINALSHVCPDAFHEVAEAVAGGDLERARRHQRETIDPVFEFCRDHGFAPSVKAALAHRDLVDSGTVRPPLDSLRGEAFDELVTVLD
ncbi:4-hydroxy-tetrahydrodipicolinate synthase [Halomicrobium zhouii]|uniref:4-hydroxy-tetrahydrodipicolinate synthase n=1 Tax=Halomicrobium zhouii TaxID=767519 RepID=A0A1I6LY94_9EURY|nr:dihydrodipicolinate synthase family protein [Halomicrobium zhouii]SFS08375.1 4-hydroxy-tetrahydrodipicolinate synthase [Halomicrobium zhouii]